MKDVDTALGIVPLGEFKAQASSLLKKLSGTDQPLVITLNGRSAAVVLSPAAFEELRERLRLLEAVAAGLADAEAGRVVDHKEVVMWLNSWGRTDESEPPRWKLSGHTAPSKTS